MIGFLVRLVLNAVALVIVAYVVPGVSVTGAGGAVLAALILGVVNAILRPILIVLTLPAVLLTLGLFTLVINAITFELVASLHLGLRTDGFVSAFWGALVLSIVSFVLSALVKPAERSSAA